MQVNAYEYWYFDRAGNAFTWWTLQDIGGLFPVVSVQAGTYAVSGPDRVRLTVTSMRIYDPLQGQYRTIEPRNSEVEFLATLDDTTLKLVMVDEPGDSAPAGQETDYATVYYRIACE